MNLMQKYLSKAKGESLKEAMFREYRQFIKWLSKYDLTVDEIKEQNPELLEKIHDAIERIDSCYIKKDYQGFLETMEKVRELYLEAVKENK